jgi:fructoselysine-6-P-deglycase FrlB-like protein
MNRVEAFVADLEAAPYALATFLHGTTRRDGIWHGLPGRLRAIRRYRLVGMGSSRFAALGVAARLRAAGLDASAELASAPALPPPDDTTILVAISSSGSTPEVIDLARRWRDDGGWVLALTNRVDSPLASVASTVDLAAGQEQSGIASRTFRHTVAALTLLGGEPLGVGAESLLPAVGAIRELLESRAEWLPSAADLLDGGDELHVVGGGDSAGAIDQAALMFREAPRVPALAMDAGDWLHVGLYTMLPGGRLLLLGGTPYDDEISRTVHARGGRAVGVGTKAGVDLAVPLPADALRDPHVRALTEPLVAELIAAELWRRTVAHERGG